MPEHATGEGVHRIESGFAGLDHWLPTRTSALRVTRNPIYLADAILFVGLSLAFRSAAALVLLPGVLAVIRYGGIAREERYLERVFGDP